VVFDTAIRAPGRRHQRIFPLDDVVVHMAEDVRMAAGTNNDVYVMATVSRRCNPGTATPMIVVCLPDSVQSIQLPFQRRLTHQHDRVDGMPTAAMAFDDYNGRLLFAYQGNLYRLSAESPRTITLVCRLDRFSLFLDVLGDGGLLYNLDLAALGVLDATTGGSVQRCPEFAQGHSRSSRLAVHRATSGGSSDNHLLAIAGRPGRFCTRPLSSVYVYRQPNGRFVWKRVLPEFYCISSMCFTPAGQLLVLCKDRDNVDILLRYC